MARKLTKKTTRSVSSKTRSSDAALEETLRLVPGYDPFADAGEAWLDHAQARFAIDFFEEHLQHVEGTHAGQAFGLEPWQKAIVGNLFGWKVRRNGSDVRRYREVFLYVPRKNGKTFLAAGICNYVFFCDREPGAQIFSAAADKEQAALLFRVVRAQIEANEQLSKRARVFGGAQQRTIVRVDDPLTTFKVLSADAHTKHGLNPHLVLVDELHAQPTRELVDVLYTGMGSTARKQPLFVMITTADYARESICNEKYAYACKVRDGVVSDPGFFPVIYEAAREDDWRSTEVWAKANPNFGVSVSVDYLARECAKAKTNPAYENTFRRLHLNQQTEQDNRWLPVDLWDSCSGPVDWAEFAGCECVVGVDLGAVRDLSAVAFVFPDPPPPYEGRLVAKVELFSPLEGIQERIDRDNVPYDVWAKQGYLRLMPTLEYDTIRDVILESAEQYNIRLIAMDPWNAAYLARELEVTHGLPVVGFKQNMAMMAPPTKQLELLLRTQGILVAESPAMRWMFGNIGVAHDPSNKEHCRPVKAKGTGRIDGIMALVMALGASNAPEVFDSQQPEILTL